MRMAGIEVIDSALTKECIALARTYSSPYLFNHVIRSWLMSTLVASSVEVNPSLIEAMRLFRHPSGKVTVAPEQGH
jgi:hypothetical protein